MRCTPLRARPVLALVLLAALLPRGAAAGISRGPWMVWPTRDGVTVCWTSAAPEIGLVRVQAEQADGARTGPVRLFEERAENALHRVTVKGLRASTRYTYEVVSGGAEARGSFATQAGRGRSVRFVAYGDNRSNPTVHQAVIAQILRFQPDFAVQSGDLVANGEVEAQWDELFSTASALFRAVPVYTLPGNHERNGAAYFRYFDYPHDYSFDVGDTHIVALDTNRPASEQAAQEEWLRKDLAANRRARWRIVCCHHTFHTATLSPGRRLESAARVARFGPILQAGKVQLVFSGHDHNYQRHEEGGITYIVSGGGGAPLYDIGEPTPFLKKAARIHHECEVTTGRDAIDVRVVADDGSLVETFRVPLAH